MNGALSYRGCLLCAVVCWVVLHIHRMCNAGGHCSNQRLFVAFEIYSDQTLRLVSIRRGEVRLLLI
jgi:hypothetical protein